MPDGLTVTPSAMGFSQTLAALVGAIEAGGAQVFAQVDHAAGATAAGMALRPTTVVIFGAAKADTPLMQADQTAGLDLPLRVLVYEDAAGAVHVAYNEPEWIAARHGLDPLALPSVAAMSRALDAVIGVVAGGSAGF
jgi:uncharacterized protein (DUF302 family)